MTKGPEDLERCVKELVDAAPPLTDEQYAKLSQLIKPTVALIKSRESCSDPDQQAV